MAGKPLCAFYCLGVKIDDKEKLDKEWEINYDVKGFWKTYNRIKENCRILAKRKRRSRAFSLLVCFGIEKSAKL